MHFSLFKILKRIFLIGGVVLGENTFTLKNKGEKKYHLAFHGNKTKENKALNRGKKRTAQRGRNKLDLTPQGVNNFIVNFPLFVFPKKKRFPVKIFCSAFFFFFTGRLFGVDVRGDERKFGGDFILIGDNRGGQLFS